VRVLGGVWERTSEGEGRKRACVRACVRKVVRESAYGVCKWWWCAYVGEVCVTREKGGGGVNWQTGPENL
jgi:hypothetical protein